MMTSKLILVLGLLTAACSGKSLDGGSNDADAAAPSSGGDGGGGTSGGGTVGTRTAGEECSETDGCIEGLACRDFAVHPSGQACQVVGQQCTKACSAGTEGDTICATLGPKYKCFRGCGEDFSCGGTL